VRFVQTPSRACREHVDADLCAAAASLDRRSGATFGIAEQDMLGMICRAAAVASLQ
jgi:hypothetical protein